MREVPKMPSEFLGRIIKQQIHIKDIPRIWTKQEEAWVLDLKAKGFTVKEIAESIGRNTTATQIKIKRLGKTTDEYNKKEVGIKYQANEKFLQMINPASILDLYCGKGWYDKELYQVTTNDSNKQMKADHNDDALRLLCRLYADKKNYDIIDLDPYGSAFECFDLAIKMAKRGIIITFGEYGHIRWKRLDFVKYRYNIHNIDEFKKEKFINRVIEIGKTNKKTLTPILDIAYNKIFRVYFKIDKHAITDQWERTSEDES